MWNIGVLRKSGYGDGDGLAFWEMWYSRGVSAFSWKRDGLWIMIHCVLEVNLF
jgi:hypothetical protein